MSLAGAASRSLGEGADADVSKRKGPSEGTGRADDRANSGGVAPLPLHVRVAPADEAVVMEHVMVVGAVERHVRQRNG
jgi:hypothetical protein